MDNINIDKMKTVIGDDTEITGSVKSSGVIQIDGKLNGDLSCTSQAVIGKTAHIKGNLSVNSISVMGQINGNITAKDRIELKSTAMVNGDIKSARLTVEDGVTFIGKSEVNPSGISTRISPKIESLSVPQTIATIKTDELPALEDANAKIRKDEIRKTVKKELKDKSGGFFGRQ